VKFVKQMKKGADLIIDLNVAKSFPSPIEIEVERGWTAVTSYSMNMGIASQIQIDY